MNVCDRRKELGLTQKELAEKCHISPTMLCDIEQGRCRPSLETALKIAHALGVEDIAFFDDLVRLKRN